MLNVNPTAARIRAARRAAGLSQAQLAALAGVGHRTIERYEAEETGNYHQRLHVLRVAQDAARAKSS